MGALAARPRACSSTRRTSRFAATWPFAPRATTTCPVAGSCPYQHAVRCPLPRARSTAAPHRGTLDEKSGELSAPTSWRRGRVATSELVCTCSPLGGSPMDNEFGGSYNEVSPAAAAILFFFCHIVPRAEHPRHASNSSTDIMRNTCAVSNTPVPQANTVNPTYFVLGGILGCVPIAYWLVQSCQVRCVCASALRVSGLGHARPLFLCVHMRIIRAIMSADNAHTANIIDAHTANVIRNSRAWR
jgi:hypothetical protein